MTKLELNEKQACRLNTLRARCGNRSGEGIFPLRRNRKIITPEQLIEVKKLNNMHWSNTQIRTKLGLSEYVVRMACRGHYDK